MAFLQARRSQIPGTRKESGEWSVRGGGARRSHETRDRCARLNGTRTIKHSGNPAVEFQPVEGKEKRSEAPLESWAEIKVFAELALSA